MAKEIITISKNKVDRLRILHRVMDRQLTQACRFYEYEGLYPAMDSLTHYILRYGLPGSFYLDKYKNPTKQPGHRISTRSCVVKEL